ncbi:MAG: aminopeptidase family protein [Clostridia bacterium]|jgi:Xaa-Pro aminopeptidase|nr:aminopeptidase family protein [Clostridia bacterium]
MEKRLAKLRERLAANNLDAAFLYSKENRRYISGFTGSTGYVVVTANKAYFITDFRYKDQAQNQCKGFEVIIHGSTTLMSEIKNAIQGSNVKRLGIEDGFMTASMYENLKSNLEGVEIAPLKDTLEAIRMIKDADEIANIEKAASIADEAFKHMLDFIKPGLTEQEVALELEYTMKKLGATDLSFESIVASGVRSSLPHGVFTDKVINNGEFLTLDFGCVYNGYCSDMTRTVFVGKADEKQKKIYNIVLEAELKVLEHIKPGMTGKDVDKVARDIITKEGYGENFGHGLGHGVGLAVHEEPRLSPMGERTLEAGMIVTDEPGIYISEYGGVRIEDLVLVTEDGCRTLSKSPKHLIEL